MRLSSKSSKTPLHKWQFTALGTPWSIETPVLLSGALQNLIADRIELFDLTYSRFRDDSLVSQLRTPGVYEFPEDCAKLMSFYKQLYVLSEGRVTPLIGSMLEDAGYDRHYSFNQQPIRPIGDFSQLGWDGERTFAPLEPIVLDVGAAGKGYMVDSIARLLEQHHITEYTIDASGDIRHRGDREMIGLEHPLDPSRVIGTASLSVGSLCASAVNRRTWGAGLHHMFDPVLRRPTQTKLATWVVSDEAMIADGLATALFFVPAKKLLTHFEFTYVTIDVDGVVDYSVDFDGELYV